MPRRCQQQGCTKSAVGATDFCVAHGGGKRCQQQGCTKSAQGATVFCKAHGGGKRCQQPGCTKSAEGATDFCKAHGGGKRCQQQGCTKSARGATDFCRAHGGGKRCRQRGCIKGAEGATDFCVAHGGGKRCQQSGCTKSAQGATDFCKAHGGGKRCHQEGCTKSAGGATDFCVAHGGGTRCKCGLFSVPREGFLCWTCRRGTERVKQFENMVESFLQEQSDLRFYTYRDEPLPCATNKRRGDFVFVLQDRIVILEVDEHAHKFYNRDCECVRVLELHEQGQGKALFLIRFNPKKSLLLKLAGLLRECFISPVPSNLLDVKFLGYKTEYSVVEEVTRIAKERHGRLSKRPRYS